MIATQIHALTTQDSQPRSTIQHVAKPEIENIRDDQWRNTADVKFAYH